MVTISQDPLNPERVTVTQTVCVYLDKVLLQTLSSEIETAIREQAVKDLKSNPAVKKIIARAATERLLQMLGAAEDKMPSTAIS